MDKIYGNEEQGELEIAAVGNQGNVTAKACGNNITKGSFHRSSGEIRFVTGAVDTFQLYSGHRTVVTVDYLIAGSYGNVIVGSRLWSQFAWYATITKIVGSA